MTSLGKKVKPSQFGGEKMDLRSPRQTTSMGLPLTARDKIALRKRHCHVFPLLIRISPLNNIPIEGRCSYDHIVLQCLSQHNMTTKIEEQTIDVLRFKILTLCCDSMMVHLQFCCYLFDTSPSLRSNI